MLSILIPYLTMVSVASAKSFQDPAVNAKAPEGGRGQLGAPLRGLGLYANAGRSDPRSFGAAPSGTRNSRRIAIHFGKLDGPIDPKGGYLFANRLDWSPATLAFGAAGPCNKALKIKPRPCLGQWSRS
jgi:hypothetical protein